MIQLYPFNVDIPIHIVQVGTGGTGSLVAQYVAQQMVTSRTTEIKGILADADSVEQKNLRNQYFIENEIGKKKADVLAKRYSNPFGIDLRSYSEEYIETTDLLMNLFDSLKANNKKETIKILISCVDNNFSRQQFHQFFNEQENIIYIDTGNDAVDLIKGNPSEEIIKQQEESGYTGQTVTGLRVKGETILAPVAELYPDVLTDEDTIAPSDISCDRVVESQPQRRITNQYSALAVNNMLNFIINQYLIVNHHIVFHAKKGYSRAFPVTEEQRQLFNLKNKSGKE
ncbi:ThiF family adenylyltransferase [Bacillus cereus]|nr:ThiF family adenylyltransferase [Bacillus cereus]